MMEVAALFVVFCVVAVGVWGVYMLVKLSDKAKEDQIEAPYKVESISLRDVAVSDGPDAPEGVWSYSAAPTHKRKYTKRSKYWAKKKKAAKKKTRKSK